MPSLHLQRLRIKLDPLISEIIAPMGLEESTAVYKLASREGIMGTVTCLADYRMDDLEQMSELYYRKNHTL